MPETEKGGARPQPKYGFEPVAAIPERTTRPRTGPRMDRQLIQGLLAASEQPGQAGIVGRYESENGADNTAKRFKQTKEQEAKGLPADYQFPVRGEWVLEPIKVDAPEELAQFFGGKPEDYEVPPGEKRIVWSLLYAMFDGPLDESEDDEAKSA